MMKSGLYPFTGSRKVSFLFFIMGQGHQNNKDSWDYLKGLCKFVGNEA